VVHSVLLDRALNDFGIDGVALARLRSFVSGQTQYVGVGASRSEVVACLSEPDQDRRHAVWHAGTMTQSGYVSRNQRR